MHFIELYVVTYHKLIQINIIVCLTIYFCVIEITSYSPNERIFMLKEFLQIVKFSHVSPISQVLKERDLQKLNDWPNIINFKKAKPEIESNEWSHLKCLDQGLASIGRA